MKQPVDRDLVAELEIWFRSVADGHWEHAFGISITTLDNPGWKVVIDVASTALEHADFREFRIDRSDTDWVDCRVENRKFQGYGGAGNLREILSSFITWAHLHSN